MPETPEKFKQYTEQFNAAIEEPFDKTTARLAFNGLRDIINELPDDDPHSNPIYLISLANKAIEGANAAGEKQAAKGFKSSVSSLKKKVSQLIDEDKPVTASSTASAKQ